MNVSVSALKATLVLSQLLAPFPVTQEARALSKDAGDNIKTIPSVILI